MPKSYFCYEGPLGLYYQFWKGNHIEIFEHMNKMAAFLGRKCIISATLLIKKAWLGMSV